MSSLYCSSSKRRRVEMEIQTAVPNDWHCLFQTTQLVIDIYTFLPFKDVCCHRRVNSKMSDILYFRFYCDNYWIKFEYNNKLIINIIKQQMCKDLIWLAKWYLQSTNGELLDYIFEFDESNDNELKNKIEKKSGSRRVRWLFKIKLNEAKLDEYALDELKSMDELMKFNKNKSSFKMIVSHELYCQVKHIKEKGAKNGFNCTPGVGWLRLGYLFEIIPLKQTLKTLLLSNTVLQNHIKTELNYMFDAEYNEYHLQETFHFLWKYVESPGHECLSSFGRFDYPIIGRPYFFADISCLGQFDLYKSYMAEIDDRVDTPMSESMRGVLPLIAAFLRLDLIENNVYKAQNVRDPGAFETLLFLLNPGYLKDLKNGLKKAMIPFTSEIEWEFNLIGNPRYHPKNRLKFLWYLCFSTQFSMAFLARKKWYHKKNYIALRKLCNDLYYDFKYFQDTWQLEQYNDFTNNIKKQEKFHEQFCVILQSLFGFCQFYINIKKDEIKDGIKLNYYYNKNHKFIDLIPDLMNNNNNNNKDNKEDTKDDNFNIDILYDLIMDGEKSEDIDECLMHPNYDRYVGEKENSRMISFHRVNNPKQCFRELYDIYGLC